MSLRLIRLWLAAVICGAGFVFAQPTPSPVMPEAMPPAPRPAVAAKKADSELLPSLQLADASIDAVLDLLEMLTGRTVVRPQSLPPATYTLQRKSPIPKDEAILVLETLLSLNQVGVAPLGDKFLKVVPLAQVKMEAPTLISGSALDLPPSGRVAAKFFQLEFLQNNEFVPLLQQQILTVGMAGGVVSFDRANAVLITDTVSNLQRVELLLKQVDRPNAAMLKPKFYSLKFAKASDIVQRLQTILQAQKMSAQVGMNSTTTISADDRTNQVIIVADSRLYAMFDDLIDKLDTKGDSNTHTEVIRLKAAECKALATLLTSLVNGQATAAQKSGQQAQRGAQPAAMPTPPPGAPNTPAAAQQAAAQSRLARALAGASGGDAVAEFSTYITIIPEERTNSIVVNGTPDDLRLIHELVDKIDVVLAQVRIEVIIADVTLDDTNATGIDALGLQVTANKLTGISVSGPTFGLGGDTASSFATLTPGGMAFGYSLTGILGLTTTPRKGKAQILSSPTIVTSHNKKGTIFSGEQRPSISGYQTGIASTTTGGYQSNVQQQQIGITLEVTPLIGDDGSVQLAIKTTVEEPLPDVIIDGNAQPHTSKRTTDSYVTAKSGEIIVLGGLQKTTETNSSSRLGPIPIIGDIFGKRSKEKHRTDLIFFLRPMVLTNTETDNDEYMKRLDGMPHKEAIKRALNPNAPVEGKPGK